MEELSETLTICYAEIDAQKVLHEQRGLQQDETLKNIEVNN